MIDLLIRKITFRLSECIMYNNPPTLQTDRQTTYDSNTTSKTLSSLSRIATVGDRAFSYIQRMCWK